MGLSDSSPQTVGQICLPKLVLRGRPPCGWFKAPPPSSTHLGAVDLPIVILPAHAEDLAGLQAAHKVRLAVLLHERWGLLGCHLVLEPGLCRRAAGRHQPQPRVLSSFQNSEGSQTPAQGLGTPPHQPGAAGGH